MKTTQQRSTAGRKLVVLVASIAAIVLMSLALPFTGLLLTSDGVAVAQTQPAAQAQAPSGDEPDKRFGDSNPRANFWKAVRNSAPGYSAVRGPEANVLMQNGGENWRALRNGPVAYWGSVVLGVVVAALAVLWLVRGRVKIEGGRTGMTVPRWSGLERLLHWVTAITFLILLVTGLSMFYGRAVLIPVLGKDAFAAWASVARMVHNYTGPVFSVGLVLLLLKLLPANIPNGSDLRWFLSGGGMIGNKHSPSGRMNGGEKFWFWLLATFGIAVVVTGLIMVIEPVLLREQAQTYLLIHASCALIVMAVSLGHIYLGTAGTEGALEGMTGGRVDVAWAKQHHDLWLEDITEKGIRPEQDSRTPAGPGAGTRPATAG